MLLCLCGLKAIAVFPGKPNSMHLAELPKPTLDAVPDQGATRAKRRRGPRGNTLATAQGAIKVFMEIAPLDSTGSNGG